MSQPADSPTTPIPQVSNSTPLSQHASSQPLNTSVSLQTANSSAVRTRRGQHTDKQRGPQPSQSDTTQSMLQKYANQSREKEKEGDAQSLINEDELPPATKEKLQSLERELNAYKSFATFTGSPPLKRTDKVM